MVLDIADGDNSNFLNWLSFGGEMTLDSYDCASPTDFPKEHIEFLRRCVPWYESEQNIFVHANYIRELPMDQQPAEVLRWDSLRYRLPGLHCSGKKAILGHTSQKNGCPLELDYLTATGI
jgi:serine/threonine protein phosphatase 1